MHCKVNSLRILLVILASLTLLASCCKHDQKGNFTHLTVSSVTVNVVGKWITSEHLEKYIALKSGSRFSEEKLNEDILRLYDSGLVEKVVAVTNPKDGMIDIHFNVDITDPILGEAVNVNE